MPYWRLLYHCVWTTKNRLPLVTDSNRETIYAAIRGKVAELGGVTQALNGLSDHVHLVVSVPPKLALARFIGQVKGISSYAAARADPAEFAWQREYGVLSLSESHLPIVVKYVLEQPRRHAEKRLNQRLEAELTRPSPLKRA